MSKLYGIMVTRIDNNFEENPFDYPTFVVDQDGNPFLTKSFGDAMSFANSDYVKNIVRKYREDYMYSVVETSVLEVL